jgi:N-dimethylarginine dimethylaminohydrolase
MNNLSLTEVISMNDVRQNDARPLTRTAARPVPMAHFLMCRPQHFAVSYTINPWMDPNSWSSEDTKLSIESQKQWTRLHRKLVKLGGKVEFVTAVPGLPDLVFTANAAVVLDGIALMARFRHAERQGEEPHYEAAFRRLQAHGQIDAIRKLPDGLVLEGAGDCIWDATRKLFWMGYGPRSQAAAREVVADTYGHDVLALELVDPRFYHMDTALVPLTGGEVMIVPEAFSPAGLASIRDRVTGDQRIELAIEDSVRFAANAVCIDRSIVLSACSDRLRGQLEERGYNVVATPLDLFLRGGGSASCLQLRLDRRSDAVRTATAA